LLKPNFREKQTLGGEWSIEVWSPFIVGHIRKNAASGDYCYFHGPLKQVNPSIEDRDLESLKRKVTARLSSGF
jgi:hypothetical protein